MEVSKTESHLSGSMIELFMQIQRQYAGKCLAFMKKSGIHPSQIPILMNVKKHNGCSQKEMAARLSIKPSTVNVSIQRLEKAGIVCRRRDEVDQRIMRVYLTEKGWEIVNSIYEFVKETDQIMFSGFTDAESCLLRRFFEQMQKNLEKIPGEPGGCEDHIKNIKKKE
jgi:DNA-binding MarR family transcriptional regulator